MCASVHDEILEAQLQGHTNVYLNYRKLSELPEELLALDKIKKLYLKRNVLKKLVRSLMYKAGTRAFGQSHLFSCRSIALSDYFLFCT